MKKALLSIGTSALLVCAAGAYAQAVRPAYAYPKLPEAQGPASIQMAGSPFYFAPYVGVAFGHDDNLFLTKNLKRSSNLYIVSPGLKLDARSTRSVFQLGYQAQIGRYTSSRNDDYEDQALRGQFDFALDRRNFVRVGGDFTYGHDPRGSNDRAISLEPDKYRVGGGNVMYAFGAPGAAGRFETYYSDVRKDYRNNRATTAFADRSTREFGGALYVRVAPKTYAVVEARDTRIKYEIPSPQDARERRYYGGVTWEASAAASGTIKVGRFQRNFEMSTVPDYSDVSWEANVTWSPRTYSRFDFYTSRFSTEASGLGTFIVSDASGITWTHDWSSFLTTSADLKYQKDDYQGFGRKDDTMALGLKMGYKFRRWLTLGAEYTYTKRNSTFDSNDYDKNLYFLTATASM